MSSPTYRFFTADLLTKNVLGDLSLFDCSADMTLNAYGNFNGSFPLGQGSVADALNLANTIPGRTALYVQRNSEWMWGGILWTRSYASDMRQCDITAQTFDSYYDRVVLERNFVKQNVDQGSILSTLVFRVNGQASSNIGITQSGSTSTGVVRTILIPAYEFHYASEVIDQLIEADDGLEYTVVIADSGTQDKPSYTLTWALTGTLNTSTSLTLDYPGNMVKFTWPENGFQGADKFAGRGGGSGNKAPIAVYADATALTAGYPSLWSVYEWPDIVDANLIKSKTRRKRATDGLPIAPPAFEVTGDAMAGMWQKLGATLPFNIADARFPGGLAGTRRMYGWSATFLDENNEETITLQTDNGLTS